jgi:ferritin-like metal-binding protein YciE
MKLAKLEDLYVDQIRDMHNAEKQLVRALPIMAKSATNSDLAVAITDHLEETRGHIERLERILQGLEKPAGRKVCKAMHGLIEEGKELLDAEGSEDVLDVGIIMAAQKIEHYEIASYGCLRTYASLLSREEDVRLLDETLEEEKIADEALTTLATGSVNPRAATA